MLKCKYNKKGAVSIEKLRVLSLFSGIGAFEKALSRQNIPYELVNFCEIDKYAIKSYCAIHNVDKNLNLGDISKVNYSNIKDIDLIVGGSPCQDFSVSGKQNGSIWTCKDCGTEFNPIQQHYSKRTKCIRCGSENLEKTRSSLLVEYLRSIRELKPKYFVYENVKNIVGKKFKDVFDLFEKELNEYGYNTYWKVLNAKNYGVSQNRERVFVIGIRKDIDSKRFVFPEGFNNGIRLKDILENVVDEKYYLSDKMFNYVLDLNEKQKGTKWEGRANNDYINLEIAHTISVRGVIGQRAGVSNIISNKEISPIKVVDYKNKLQSKTNNHDLRNLIPLECWRLMGFNDEDFYKAKAAGISDTQLYKQAGNSIVVNVLEYIFKNLFLK